MRSQSALLVALSTSASVGFAEPLINEVMANNESTLADGQGEFDDWVEIYNGGNTPLDLSGYFLSDDAGDVARRFDQKSLMGSILDPLTDKALLLTGLITLTLVDWGQDWHLPMWFLILVILRDTEIIVGIWILYLINRRVPIRPHWSGKVCTVTQMIALGWVMLKLFDLSPIYPVAIATVFTLWSGVEYFREGLRQLREIKRPGR
ncbi:lamin tail domain-containing protein [Akkermansiaceae bacterium]|nr:lamin tail domain-containing protein [Akkermansiaceae bacterium]